MTDSEVPQGNQDGASGGLHETAEPKDSMSLPTLQELLEGHSKWWKERVDQTNSDFGFYGRDLRNQDDLLKTVLGMENDITFLLRYVRSLTEHIGLVATDKETSND